MKLNNDSGNCSRLNHTQRLRGNIYRFLLTFYPFCKKVQRRAKASDSSPRLFASCMSERTFGFERAYGISLKRTMSSPYPKPRKRRTKNRKGIFPSLLKRTGSFSIFGLFPRLYLIRFRFSVHQIPFYANSNKVFLLNHS